MRWLISALLVLLAACGGDGQDPADELRAWVGDAEAAVEARSIAQSSRLISDTYRDAEARDKRLINRTLLAYLHGHRAIHLLTRIRQIEVSPEGDRGGMAVFVAMAGVPIESAQALVSLTADFHRFDLQLVKTDGEWLLQSAQWQRAALTDFVPD